MDGTLTTFLHDGVEEIGDYNASGTLLRRYVHGPGVDEYLVMYTGAGTTNKSYFHANHQGSIIAMSDGGGNVTEQHSYDAYGNSDELTGNPFRYTGRRLDEETGLYYYRARYYSPAIGRFLQTDPIGYGDGLNWYAYVGNDPMNANDPMGLCKIEDGKADCVKLPENYDKLTKDQKEIVDGINNQISEIGKMIEDNGDENLKNAWADVSVIEIDLGDNGHSNNAGGYITLTGEAVKPNNEDVDSVDHQRFVITHEIYHSEKTRKTLMDKAIKEDGGYLNEVYGSKTRGEEQRTDRDAYKFLYKNSAFKKDYGYLGQSKMSGYWP